MNISCYNGFNFITSELLSAYGIKHLFSTIKDTERNLEHGVGFSTREGFCKEQILENYRKTAEFLNVPFENITKSTQIHEDNILIIENKHIGMGVSKETDIKNADGLMTDKPDVPLCIFSADCVPVLIADKNKKVVAAVHSGWRGTVGKIGQVTLQKMEKEYGTNPGDVLAAIGPSICQCCYEVSEDVICQFKESFDQKHWSDLFYQKENRKFQLNLWKANEIILREAGVQKENLAITNVCTSCNHEILFSHRASKGQRGGLAAFLALK